MKTFYIVWVCLLVSHMMQAQQSSSLVTMPLKSCEVLTNGQYVVLSSIEVLDGESVLDSVEIIHTDTSIIIVTESCFEVMTGVKNPMIRYRVFPFNPQFEVSLLNKDSLTVKMDHQDSSKWTYLPQRLSSVGLIDAGNLNYSGSFTRGFSIGNAQSFVPNSNFNLQMSGDLGGGVEITAAITDESIPIQPEGNTQVLQEFDRVFIQLQKGQQSLIAGDYIIQRPQSYFMNYLKKLKGLGLRTAYAQPNKKWRSYAETNLSSSRGKFRRQALDIREGNQGPYRLTGNNNERFIIVLSGSEKVYYNGELIERGIEYDYIIDYNTSEIIFSPNRLVSKETRVIVEFEYTDQNYFRTLYTVNTGINNDKVGFNFSFYSEQDSKNSTSQISLDSIDRSILRASGDDRSLSVRSGIRSFEGEELGIGVVGYRLVDNTIDPSYGGAQILVFTNDIDSVEVTASFNEVGSGMGSYRLKQGAQVNGRVYEYVGEGLGSYAPVIQVIPPEQRRMMALGGYYDVNDFTRIESEFALSDFDLNRLSPLQDNDNVGLATKIGYTTKPIIDKSRDLRLVHLVNLELIDANFNPLNPYRNAEFTRDWNRQQAYTEAEVLFQGGVGFEANKQNRLLYKFDHYKAKGTFDGQRHGLQVAWKKWGFDLTGNPSLTQTHGDTLRTYFWRPNFKFSKSFEGLDQFQVGIDFEGEQNEQKNTEGELLPISYQFGYLKTFIQSNKERDVHMRLSYNRRKDKFAGFDQLSDAIDITEYELGGHWTAGKVSNLLLSLKMRDFDVINPALVRTETDKKTILGSLDHSLQLWKNGLLANTSYLLSSGQEARQEYVFQQVENFRGEYVYVGQDTSSSFNINDFRYDPSNPAANFIRIPVPNNEFIKTNNIGLNHSLKLEPNQWIGGDTTKVAQFLKRWSTYSTIRITAKTTDNAKYQYNPFVGDVADSLLVAYSQLQTHSVFFNKGNPTFDITYTYRSNIDKSNQVNGSEERSIGENEVRVRYGIGSNTDVIATLGEGRRTFDSQLFDPRDFNIKYYRLQPELNIRPSTAWRLVFGYKYEDREQRINNLESAKSHDLSIQTTIRRKNKSSFDASLNFVSIKYRGETNSAIAYDILDGLRNGSNILWNATYTRRLNNSLDLTISYSGRKTGDAAVIHLGRMQAKASF